MAVHSKDEALMCKAFPFSLGPVAMRWFDSLKADFISSFKELTQEFGPHSDFNDLAINTFKFKLNTFKFKLPADHGLRKSLTGKPVTSVRQLMDRIDKYKRTEEDQQQRKGKDKVIPQKRRDFCSNQYSNNKSRRDYTGQSGLVNLQVVNVVFRD
nr:uncharacterized protein LOC111994389 [Quercus suber]